jgi:ferritin-like metal-binding protein YciE
MKIANMDDLFLHGLQRIYDAEQQLTEALPKLADASSTPQLREAFTQHLDETKQHVLRTQEIFKQLSKQPEAKPNATLQQMRQDAEQIIQNTEKSPVRDAALIVAGNEAEHFEMACWGSLRTFAQLLGYNNIVPLIEKILQEEKNADAKLTEIGESQVNVQALHQGTAASAR